MVCLLRGKIKSLHCSKDQIQDTPKSVLFTGAAVTGLGDHRGCRSAVLSWPGMRGSLPFRCIFSFPWNIFSVFSLSSGLIVLLKSQPSSLPFPACHVASSAFSTLSAQAEQLVLKETGGWLPGKMNGFHGNRTESLALGEDPCQQPHLVLALLFGCVQVVYTSDALINSPSHGVGRWNSFIPAWAPLSTQTENRQRAAVLSACLVN